MKKIIVILLIVLAIVWGVGNKEQVLDYVDQGKKWFNTTILKKDVEDGEADIASEEDSGAPEKKSSGSKATGKSKSTKDQDKTEPEPVVVEELPEGWYYTRERITKVTDLGVSAIAKAVKVQKIGEENGDYIVNDGTNELSAGPHLLTRDSQEISEMLTAIAAAAPAPKPKTTAASSTSSSASSPVKKGPSSEVLYLRQKVKSLDERIYQLQSEIRKLEAEHAYAKMRGRVSSVHVQIGRVQGQLNGVQAERNKTAQQLADAE